MKWFAHKLATDPRAQTALVGVVAGAFGAAAGEANWSGFASALLQAFVIFAGG